MTDEPLEVPLEERLQIALRLIKGLGEVITEFEESYERVMSEAEDAMAKLEEAVRGRRAP